MSMLPNRAFSSAATPAIHILGELAATKDPAEPCSSARGHAGLVGEAELGGRECCAAASHIVAIDPYCSYRLPK
jgi:hypothetical protein